MYNGKLIDINAFHYDSTVLICILVFLFLSPSRYYMLNRGLSEYYGYPPGPQYMDEYPLYPGGMRESICTVSGVGGYDHHWSVEDKRRSLRDGPQQQYGPTMMRDFWRPQHYGVEASMRRLSLQPRSRSVPRSPSSSSGGLYSPLPPNYVSPARSPSTRFDHDTVRMRDDNMYVDHSVYSLPRSLSSPKVRHAWDKLVTLLLN